MTVEELKAKGWIIYECISGSKAYGTDVEGSDTDIRGVFLLPQATLYSMDYLPQVSDDRNDTVYYELGRYFELLYKNNPNMLELLATPEDKILYQHPLIKTIDPELFLSKKCKNTFGGYAFTQIRKARGLNKKIVNPLEKERKTILAFCYVLQGHGSVPLEKWLSKKQFDQKQIGLASVPHFKDVYAMFYDKEAKLGFKGIMKKPAANMVALTSIPKGMEAVGYLHFNKDGYQSYCKDYREYWDWVAKRNESRYQNNLEHGKNYDSKNMMHTFRLLDMAYEILSEGKIEVARSNRSELLSIRRGEWAYDDLITKAEKMMKRVEEAYENSSLPKAPDKLKINALLADLRTKFYGH